MCCCTAVRMPANRSPNKPAPDHHGAQHACWRSHAHESRRTHVQYPNTSCALEYSSCVTHRHTILGRAISGGGSYLGSMRLERGQLVKIQVELLHRAQWDAHRLPGHALLVQHLLTWSQCSCGQPCKLLLTCMLFCACKIGCSGRPVKSMLQAH